jgi:serine/threonine protein kinase
MCSLGQINGYGLSVDWWSLAVVMYECLVGRRPFEFSQSSSSVQVLRLIASESMVVPANWPSDLISFINSMLCFDLSRRIATFEAFRTHRYMERIDFDSVLAR